MNEERMGRKAAARATRPVPEGLVEELQRLASMAARRSDLVVLAGEPGCGWSFRWTDARIQVDPDDLATRAPDLCRGLVVHEAAHAAVTRFEELLPPSRLKTLMPLLNVIEDCRIETWLRAQLPGSAAWIRAYNDVLFGEMRALPVPRSRRAQLLRGLLEGWWFGETPLGILPEVTQALRSTAGPVARAIDSQPPVGESSPKQLLDAQRTMWRTVEAGVLPVWERLEAADRADGIGQLAEHELEALLALLGAGAHLLPRAGSGRPGLPGGHGLALVVEGDAHVAPPPGTPVAAADAISASLHTDGSDDYLSAWRRVQSMSDRVADEFLRQLLPMRRLRWSRGHPWGARLDVKRAMQFSADPRRANDLWMRPLVPDRKEPEFMLLLDRSASMGARGRIAAAFDGLVLLVEALRRIGVPASVASFATDERVDLGSDDAVDDAGRRQVGRLLKGCNGGTNMAAALRAVRGRFSRSAATQRVLFVLGDGQPDNVEAAKAAVAGLEADDVRCIGLGLGHETQALAGLFRTSAVDLTVEQLPARLAGLLSEALAA